MAMDFKEVAGQPGQESLFGRLGLGNWAGQERMGTGLVSLEYRRCAGQRGGTGLCTGAGFKKKKKNNLYLSSNQLYNSNIAHLLNGT